MVGRDRQVQIGSFPDFYDFACSCDEERSGCFVSWQGGFVLQKKDTNYSALMPCGLPYGKAPGWGRSVCFGRGLFARDVPECRAGRGGVLCGKYLSTLRKVLEYLPQSTILCSARGGGGFCREKGGDGYGVSSCKGMFEAAGLLSFADGRIYVFFITEARQPQRPVFGPCMAVWESLWSGMPYFILL